MDLQWLASVDCEAEPVREMEGEGEGRGEREVDEGYWLYIVKYCIPLNRGLLQIEACPV